MNQASIWDDAEVISTYTRAQAIADGELVDVTTTAREAGIAYPVALTPAVWSDCCEWTDEDKKRSRSVPDGQSTAGRLWDVVSMARFAIVGEQRRVRAGAAPRSELLYGLLRKPRPGRGRRRRVTLKLHVGGGDDGSPVITIMEPHED